MIFHCNGALISRLAAGGADGQHETLLCAGGLTNGYSLPAMYMCSCIPFPCLIIISCRVIRSIRIGVISVISVISVVFIRILGSNCFQSFPIYRQGFAVTVFDKNEAAGGLLRYGIPNFKLNKLIIDRRIDLMEKEGITFRYGVDVTLPEGKDIVTGEDIAALLGQAFDAYVIATGTPTARDLNIPGRELKGVHLALELLAQQNRVLAGMEFAKADRVTAKGKDVLVIGGGDTGSDCIGTSHRQGCKSVTQIEIMPKPVEGPEDPNSPWPNWPRTLKTTSSHEEGCTRRWNINSLEFLGKDGKLTGVRVQPIDWKPNPEGGRPIMVEAGEPEVIKCEICFLAMGFLKPQQPKFADNVFVAGDAANGASLVVRAMASGRETAKKVQAFLAK